MLVHDSRLSIVTMMPFRWTHH